MKFKVILGYIETSGITWAICTPVSPEVWRPLSGTISRPFHLSPIALGTCVSSFTPSGVPKRS